MSQHSSSALRRRSVSRWRWLSANGPGMPGRGGPDHNSSAVRHAFALEPNWPRRRSSGRRRSARWHLD